MAIYQLPLNLIKSFITNMLNTWILKVETVDKVRGLSLELMYCLCYFFVLTICVNVRIYKLSFGIVNCIVV